MIADGDLEVTDRRFQQAKGGDFSHLFQTELVTSQASPHRSQTGSKPNQSTGTGSVEHLEALHFTLCV